MSFRIKRKETIPDGIRRIVQEQIDGILTYVHNPEADKVEAVHESRRKLKRIRSMLRVVRNAVGKSVYQQENVRFRDAGRTISDVRDSAVRIATLEKLKTQFPDRLEAASFDRILEGFRDRHKEVEQDVIHGDQAMQELGRVMEEAKGRLLEWPLKKDRFSVLHDGLEDIYRKAKVQLKETWKDPTNENLHECRKRLKDLRYMMDLLAPVWPRMIKGLCKALNRMTDLLGDDHDLAMLRQTLVDEAEAGKNSAEQGVLLELIDRRRQDLQTKVRPIAERVLAESPDAFADRMEKYWKIYRKAVPPSSPDPATPSRAKKSVKK